ncbi:ribonuclease III [Suhomyces tanzawaensis NRRL Y-17324]|uniref:Ribonuclease III n=1 Tax=Suhomyces tanzawaensis NRRL Y-17324 TaxID=984487 RepID=A0A1E4SDD8_9ASCO|nr:ribonuclease III [Suhomyces tanzawaensis NRRL Y-17324]ODV77530.1 ribonuclease III [Suhomyces tanzawaensis NRRL Y-17324]
MIKGTIHQTWSRSLGVVSRRSYHVPSINKALKTEYDTINDYGSYKNNVFTHRLPESTAQQSPSLVALHSRLNLPSKYSLSTLSQALNLNINDGLVNNFGLNTLGKNLLSYYVSEHLLVKYPRLPMPIHNVAVDSLMGHETLHEIGKIWGIQVDSSTKLDKYLSQESEFIKYGKLRFLSEQQKGEVKESGVHELSSQESKTKIDSSFISDEAQAYASAVRSIIGGLYTHTGEEATKKFIQDHILSRKLPLEEMFQFNQPTRELVRLCDKLNFAEPLEIRLIAETGRLSAHAIYVAGAFCGTEKLGEGIGSSIAEAKTRSVVNALMSYYLYSPLDSEGNAAKVPSDKDYKFEGIVGLGDVSI